MLDENRDILDRIALALLSRETLDRHELELLRLGEELPVLVSPLAEPRPVSDDARPHEPKKDFPGGNIPDPEPIPS